MIYYIYILYIIVSCKFKKIENASFLHNLVYLNELSEMVL